VVGGGNQLRKLWQRREGPHAVMYQSIASVQCLEVYLTRCIKGLNAITIVTASPGWKEKAVMLRIGLAGRRKENPADSALILGSYTTS